MTLLKLLLMHVGTTVDPERSVWYIPHMYSEGIGW